MVVLFLHVIHRGCQMELSIASLTNVPCYRFEARSRVFRRPMCYSFSLVLSFAISLFLLCGRMTRPGHSLHTQLLFRSTSETCSYDEAGTVQTA